MFKAELIGNLGADAEIKSGEGYAFVSLRIANTEKWRDEAGTEHTNTDWIDVVYSNTDSALLHGHLYVNGNLFEVSKYYQANAETSKWKKDDFAVLVDKAGNRYKMIKGGWVAPIVEDEQVNQESSEEAQ